MRRPSNVCCSAFINGRPLHTSALHAHSQVHVRLKYLLPRKHVKAYRALADQHVTAEMQVGLRGLCVAVRLVLACKLSRVLHPLNYPPTQPAKCMHAGCAT